jgi:hypothetical protein
MSRPVLGIKQPYLDGHGWIDIKVSQVLGFPLRMMLTSDGDSSLPNAHVESLDIEPNPDSPLFGQCSLQPNPTGSVLVVRSDQKELHMNHVDALSRYIEQGLKESRQVKKREAPGKKIDRKVRQSIWSCQHSGYELTFEQEMAARLLNPEMFKRFFKIMKAAQMVREPKAREGVMCPTNVG